MLIPISLYFLLAIIVVDLIDTMLENEKLRGVDLSVGIAERIPIAFLVYYDLTYYAVYIITMTIFIAISIMNMIEYKLAYTEPILPALFTSSSIYVDYAIPVFAGILISTVALMSKK